MSMINIKKKAIVSAIYINNNNIISQYLKILLIRNFGLHFQTHSRSLIEFLEELKLTKSNILIITKF